MTEHNGTLPKHSNLLYNNAPKPSGNDQQLQIMASRQLGSWMAEVKTSLAFTTYQASKLFFVGLKDDGQLSIFERTFARCMGLYAQGDALYTSSLYQIWKFQNALVGSQTYQSKNIAYDRLFVPQVGYTTGDIDVHDIAEDAEGNAIFVSALFSCIAKVSTTHSFTPLWKPPFISKLAAEDRCHLNGMATENGVPRYATAVSDTDMANSWRDHRSEGGVLIDVSSNEIVLRGLSMPHSPRLYQDKLWLLDSGRGRFGYVDLKAGRFETVALCPGYMRGLAFRGKYAIVGLSRPRGDASFTGLELDTMLAKQRTEPWCGLAVIDLERGDLVHSLQIKGIVSELYDVALIPDARRPAGLGFQSEEIRRSLSIDESALR